jgi:hypothetical protein
LAQEDRACIVEVGISDVSGIADLLAEFVVADSVRVGKRILRLA